MPEFTPVSALIGGAMIGLAASLLMLSHGKIAGISGLYGGLVLPHSPQRGYRAWFIAGLLLAGALFVVVHPQVFGGVDVLARPLWLAGLAGLLVGYGTRVGNGCTSGHGVCGLSRFSKRSFAATLTFIGTGMATVFFIQQAVKL